VIVEERPLFNGARGELGMFLTEGQSHAVLVRNEEGRDEPKKTESATTHFITKFKPVPGSILNSAIKRHINSCLLWFILCFLDRK
jgi:hypothetical protein